ncbi:hypothetical protein [Idiomarina aminovorans]|uniref:hypothetical protein n=1 Tax=Idiomarina aminovorans TaxID=2914829 RepID=UPI002006779A|nr:hypothetical protein [Idiomarina sp. ATCH4]MCK7458845.1 hypothetical protein [Idiomarina sp. ATCH4]
MAYIPQKIAKNLFTDGRIRGDSTELLLKLVENGTIGINESLRRGATHYTPIFAALVSGSELTESQFKKFIDLGANVDASFVGLMAMAKITNDKVLEQWKIEAGVGSEHYEDLLMQGLINGNPNLISMVRKEIPQATNSYRINKKNINQVFAHVTGAVDHENIAKLLKSNDKRANLIGYKNRLKRRRGQIDVLAREGELSKEQLRKLSDSRDQYENLIKK